MIMEKKFNSDKLTMDWISESADMTKKCLIHDMITEDIDWNAIYGYPDRKITDFLLAEQSFLNESQTYMLGVSNLVKLPRYEITIYRDLQGQIFAIGRTEIMGDSFGEDYRAESEDELVRMILSILHEGIMYICHDIQEYVAVPAMDFLVQSFTDQAIINWYTNTVPNEFLTKLFNIGKVAVLF